MWFFNKSKCQVPSSYRSGRLTDGLPLLSSSFLSLRTLQTIYFLLLIAFFNSPLVIVLSSDANFTVCFLSSPFSIVTPTALNDFSNADLTSVLHPAHVTPDIVKVYFVSACAVATKRPNSAIANLFI